ncbi:2Fe-2S iron-sulfur cluster-binding protein [Pusillimonas sp.]|uniref:2Fe-2S iron-sulfur cluster-binding protein n=1 Tax=Pusillimonas sp. TaxID=3040095 RepID=UPI0037CAAE18
MPKVVFVHHDGSSTLVEGRAGTTVMQLAVDNMVEGIVGDCGGALSCATCHGYVDSAWLDRIPPASETELEMIPCAVAPKNNSRLCCQIVVDDALDGLIIRLPEAQI